MKARFKEALTESDKARLSPTYKIAMGTIAVLLMAYWAYDHFSARTAPKCSESGVLTTLRELIHREVPAEFALAFSAIRTVSLNDQTGARHCAAIVKATHPNQGAVGESVDITYHIEVLENRRAGFVVTLDTE